MKRKVKYYLLNRLRRIGTSNPSKKSNRLSALVEELLLSGKMQYAIFSYICSYLNSLEKESWASSSLKNHLEKNRERLKKTLAYEKKLNKKKRPAQT